ncbi:MAG: DUF1499 domain-containing protein [Cyanobacteriota bacterium]|nr:DUF1499 domain-containing protein [Cyanobacteriota bacterium]
MSRAVWPLLLTLGLVLLAPVAEARAALLHLEGPPPADLGVGAMGLAPCRSTAHCAWASWPVADPQGALSQLLPAVLALDGVELVDTSESYLHATVTSRLFGFVDDLELFADGPRGQLQARSQSRLGDSDLGVNGRRLERLGGALERSERALAIARGSAGEPS